MREIYKHSSSLSHQNYSMGVKKRTGSNFAGALIVVYNNAGRLVFPASPRILCKHVRGRMQRLVLNRS